MARILIVEDDTDLRDMLNESLMQAGYHTRAVADIRAARDALANLPYDLILLDWMLPDASGLQWLRKMRREDKFRDLPVIMLTARGEVSDRVQGLDSGADDYLVKPFSLKELLARIRSQLRRNQPHLHRLAQARQQARCRPEDFNTSFRTVELDRKLLCRDLQPGQVVAA